MSRGNLVLLVSIPLVVLLGLTLSYSAPLLRERDQHYELVRLLVDVLGEVDQNYVRELDDAGRRMLVENMINGGLERLDPHSGFLGAQEFTQFERKSKGKFGGVGIQIELNRTTGFLTVTSPIIGSPAYEAGIMAGDRILKVDGKPIDALANPEAAEMIQGDPGSSVTLTILHEGETQSVDITLVRAIIEVETVTGAHRNSEDPRQWEFVIDPERKIAYVRIIEFDEPTSNDLKKIIEKLDADAVRGLVLDLRGNPGGLLTSAVEVSDLFMISGRIVSTRGRREQERIYSAKAPGTIFEPASDRPIAVLIDRGSASASEIVAAALQDAGRAVVVGERSFGKGSVQNVYALENHTTALKLTTQSYWRPNGKNIHRFPDSKESDDWGVRPNQGLEVTLTDAERVAFQTDRRKRDHVKGKPAAGKKESPAAIKDKSLEKALEYLRAQIPI